jgi:S-DNA-T family DNA segregation ATPase FtsK/SpoIIIE
MHCGECDYDYDELERAELAPALRADARALTSLLSDAADQLRTRPAPNVWSALEYGCHVRDIFEVQRARIELALRVDHPAFAPMGRDERAVRDRYNEQPLGAVIGALLDQADELASVLEGLDDDGWARTGIYNYPAPADRTVEWIARHTLHEARHHERDIDQGLAQIRSSD